MHRGHVGFGVAHLTALESELHLPQLVLRGEAGVDHGARLIDKAAPIAFDHAEFEHRVGMKQMLHHPPAPPINRVGIGSENVADGFAVFKRTGHASSSTITLPILPPVNSLA